MTLTAISRSILGLERRGHTCLPGLWWGLTTLTTATEVPEDIIALLREGDLIHGMSDETCLQKPTGILAGLPSLRKALHMMIKPIDHIRA